jgi:hypothetical protein
VTRESRIEKARRMAAETSEQRAIERAVDADRRANEIASMSSDAAIIEAGRIKADTSIGWLGPISTPSEWTEALIAAREVVIESAMRGELLTYGELQVAAFRATEMKIGHSMYGRFCMELNQFDNHGCLISSIIVHTDTRDPGPGLIPYAQSLGIDKPVRTLQREVFETFGGARRTLEE